MDRRGFLRLGGTAALGGAVLVGTGGCGSPESRQTAVLLRSRRSAPPRFRVPLPVPPVKRPIRTADGADEYVIEQRAGELEVFSDAATPVLGYDGMFPGPTIRSRSGRTTVVEHRNRLSVPTVVHLHGGHTPAASDGYPTDLVLPAGDRGRNSRGHSTHHRGDVSDGMRRYMYPMRQRAATLWYHDHRMDHTATQVYRGLAGFHIVEDAVERALPLPDAERDLPLMLADRSFEADGRFRYPLGEDGVHVADDWMSGVLGDVILVNGAPWPVHDTVTARYRLRLLNASNARRYGLELVTDSGRRLDLVQIGSDGGLLPAPIRHRRIDMAPAERFDVVVDFGDLEPGTSVTVRNVLGSGPTSDVMRFRITRRVRDDSSVPRRLAEVERLHAGADAPVREWRFSRGSIDGHAGWVVNGKAFDPDRMDAEVRLDRTEVWRFHTDLHHPVHVHLDPFQVRGRGSGSTPGRYDHGWKDTIDLRPAEQAEVLVRFTEYAGPYLLHCHNLEHEDMMMMAAFRTR